MVINTLQSLRKQECYNLFWEKVVKEADSIGVEKPKLPRRCKFSACYDVSLAIDHTRLSKGTLPATVLWGSWQHNQLPEGSIQSTWLQHLLHSGGALDQGQYEKRLKEPLQVVCDFYQDDFNHNLLEAQFFTFGVSFQHDSDKSTKLSIFDIRDHFKALSPAQKNLLSQVGQVLQLVLVMPATNATSERSFSALRQVRSTMGQPRLNNLLLLHVHKECTDSLNLTETANEFVIESECRLRIFAITIHCTL